ncbi:hypothetical protein CVV38_01050 [Candidatus Peregrinibacteria bacterium HGW-Peregrinibacteria-1]|jgi:MFS family permease|nr:MAG: hypothetical protein CVV38_01050 [Candidatus Peregrinibacteria bacterium HGW-Peregrinibacteria-1]
MKAQVSAFNVRLLKWFNFFSEFRLYAPVAIIYFSQVTGSFALGLSIFSITSVSMAVFEVPTGAFSDILGRKKTIMLGAGASALALVFFALGGSFWMLAIGAVIMGLAEAFFSGNNDALLYDSLRTDSRVKEFPGVFGKVSSMYELGLSISAFIGGFVADWSLEFVIWLSVLPQLICLVLSFFFIEPKRHSRKIQANVFKHLKDAFLQFRKKWRLRTLSATSILNWSISGSMHQFLPAFYMTILPTWALGLPNALGYFMSWLGYHNAGRIIGRFRETTLMLSGTLFDRVMEFMAYRWPSVYSPIFIVMTSFTYGVNTVASASLLHKEFMSSKRATMGSLNSLAGNMLFAVFAILLGMWADVVGPAKALLTASLSLLVLIPLYAILSHEQRQKLTFRNVK